VTPLTTLARATSSSITEMSQRHQKEETVMVKSSVWALGAIGLAAVGVVVGGWHPWMGASHVC